jgi:hypothetical protein
MEKGLNRPKFSNNNNNNNLTSIQSEKIDNLNRKLDFIIANMNTTNKINFLERGNLSNPNEGNQYSKSFDTKNTNILNKIDSESVEEEGEGNISIEGNQFNLEFINRNNYYNSDDNISAVSNRSIKEISVKTEPIYINEEDVNISRKVLSKPTISISKSNTKIFSQNNDLKSNDLKSLSPERFLIKGPKISQVIFPKF